MKRTFDLIVASVGIVATTPLSLIAALLIKLDSRGPVFHRAERVGMEGRLFTMLKFRTMKVGEPIGHSGITSAADPRITRAGRPLRRLKLDEIPQLVNVLRGEMSLVGPRPEDPRYVALYTPEQRRVLSVRPGMTSPASLEYRNEEQLLQARGGDTGFIYASEIVPAKLDLDLAYVDGRSFWTDIGIMVKTVLAVVARRPHRANRRARKLQNRGLNF